MLKETYADVCMAIVYHVGQGRDMGRESQTATGLVLMRDIDGLRRILARLTE